MINDIDGIINKNNTYNNHKIQFLLLKEFIESIIYNINKIVITIKNKIIVINCLKFIFLLLILFFYFFYYF